MKEEKRKNFKEKIDEVRNERMKLAMKCIFCKKQKYRSKYFVEPRFIKIPIWLYEDILYESSDFHRPCNVPGMVEKLFGLIVCPTESIKTIGEIEVF